MATRAEIREFANRRWNISTSLDRRHWAEAFRATGGMAGVLASQALWRHMKSIRPEWPDAAQRRRDLEHHVGFKALLDLAGRGLPAR